MMFDVTFKAKIRKGAKISHDHHFGLEWPQCFAPGGAYRADDPDMEFEATLRDRWIELRAPGFGVLNKTPSQYGSGTIHVDNIADLIISDADKKRAVEYLREKKQDQIDKVTRDLAGLMGEMDALR